MARAAHILIIPYPAQGHMLPLLHLARLLSLRHLSVTIVTTPKNLPLLSPLLSSSPSIQTLVLPFPAGYPSLPHDAENTKDLPPPLSPFLSFMHAVSFLRTPILDWARSVTTDPPQAIICDFFAGWAHQLAGQLGIPCVTFSPYSAHSLSIVRRLWHDMPRRGPRDDGGLNFPVGFPSVPGSPVLLWHQLSTVFTSYREGDPLSEFIRDSFLANFNGEGIVFNSFEELEGDYLEHVRRVSDHVQVFAVGPVNSYFPGEQGGGYSLTGDLKAWLDGCEEESVVYVCFGSQLELSREQGEAMAAGLERSGARFIWCVRGGPEEAVPEGFEERMRGRGAVVRGWAPQVELLGHPAVGAYFTHCGFNSVMEAISAGVAMLAWPMLTDQYMNARLVTEVARVGVRVCEGNGVVPDSDRLARGIAEIMARDCKVRDRARELKRRALEAVSVEGSSSQNLDMLVDMLSNHIKPTDL